MTTATINIPTPVTAEQLGASEMHYERSASPASADPFAAQLRYRLTPQQTGEQAREAAQELVSFGLILPLLKQMREDPFRTELFHGGQGERVFSAQLDQHIADRMGRRMEMSLTDAIYKRFIKTPPSAGVDQRG